MSGGMKISTFRASDMREALRMVKEELGADAVILSTRRVRETKGGLPLGRSLIEVTACPNPKAVGRQLLQEGAGRATPPGTPPLSPPLPAMEPRGGNLPPPRPVAPPPPPAPMPGPRVAPDELSNIRNTLVSLEERVSSLPDKVAEQVKKSAAVPGLDAVGQRRYGWFLMHGVEEPIARQLAAAERAAKDGGLVAVLQKFLGFRDPLSSGARAIALVGPTGVGKTTTLAKMAAELILNRRRTVGFITLDTFRVGAVAQLETYARLLQVRMVVARSASEVAAGVHSLAHCDHILVDTVGTSPYNRRQVNTTADLLPALGEPREVLLCMAGNVRETEQRAIFRRFHNLNPTGLIFTKLDETVTYGGVLNVALRARLPLTVYTDGQRVPENLGWMAPEVIANWFEDSRRDDHGEPDRE